MNGSLAHFQSVGQLADAQTPFGPGNEPKHEKRFFDGRGLIFSGHSFTSLNNF
jgi:hypothetical protein